MRKQLKVLIEKIKSGRLQEMWRQTKWIYQYASHNWGAMIFYTVLGMTGTLVSLGGSLISRDLVDIITGKQTGKLMLTFCMMIGINLGNTFVTQISNYVSNKISMRVDAEIKADIFSKILVTDWESLTNYHTGDLLSRWSTDAGNISSGVLNFIPNLIIYVFRFISAFAMVVYHDASFAVFAFLSMPVSLLLSKKLMKRMVNNNKRSAQMSAKVTGFNQEAFSNIQTIKAFNLISLYRRKLTEIQKESIAMRLDFQKMSMGTSFLLTSVALIVSYAAYGWGIYRVWSGAISYGTMTMFLGLSSTLTGTLNNLTSLVPTAISLTTSAGRLMDIVEMPREDYSAVPRVEAFAQRHEEDGIGLYARDISYAYANGTQVFHAVNMEAKPHEIVAVVGPSGEGKTTMLRLMLSLMKTQSGEIMLCGGERKPDSPDAETLELSPAARSLFSYVPQGNTMFSGTIAENMRNVREDATEEEIVQALKKACAWEFVSRLPKGIYSEIKERGGGYSEGQAQRLSIARALLRKAPILLLDEATSALDMETERKVLENITRDESPRTCIVTTHRPTVLRACNRVYEIRDGECHVLSGQQVEERLAGI